MRLFRREATLYETSFQTKILYHSKTNKKLPPSAKRRELKTKNHPFRKTHETILHETNSSPVPTLTLEGVVRNRYFGKSPDLWCIASPSPSQRIRTSGIVRGSTPITVAGPFRIFTWFLFHFPFPCINKGNGKTKITFRIKLLNAMICIYEKRQNANFGINRSNLQIIIT